MLRWSVSGPIDESPRRHLKTGNLHNDLYHGDDYLDPVSATTYHNMKKRLRTHTGGAHPADRSADDQLPRIL